jgi:hypothetical protein
MPGCIKELPFIVGLINKEIVKISCGTLLITDKMA